MSVCLVMIVRDEANVIDRCLESVRGLIDRWTIVDTGSQDGTKQRIRKALNGVPGELHDRPWRSFGENLTEAISLAEGDWLLRLDADMTVEWHEDFRSWLSTDPDPDVDAWNVQIVDGTLSYRLPLLMRGGVDWSYVGPTHEYLEGGGKRRDLLGLTVHHHADGGVRAGKFERDRDLLIDHLDQNPGDARSTFYLAQTYRDLGETENAIVFYEARASMNGWDEERWFARYQSAKLRGSSDDLIACWRERPWRHEPLTEAAAIADQMPNEDRLFREARPR